MNEQEINVVRRIQTAADLILRGAFADTRAALAGVEAQDSPDLSLLAKTVSQLNEKILQLQAAPQEALASARKEQEQERRLHGQFLHALLASIPSPVFYKDIQARYTGCNRAFEELVGKSEEEIRGKTVHELWPEKYAATYRDKDMELIQNPGKQQYEFQLSDSQGKPRDVVFYKSTFPDAEGKVAGVVGVILDITERKRHERMELELRQAQKLQAVGQLAAGMAHELNTPAQFVGDSIRFLSEAHDDEKKLLDSYRGVISRLAAAPQHEELLKEIEEAEKEADIEYIEENTPGAFRSALEGIARISTLVKALKEFAHTDHAEKKAADLNKALQATLCIARNEYKYVADVEAEFGVIPLVECNLGEINQVFLNLLVNAAHAIGERMGKDGKKGRITVRSALEGDRVRIDISDTGCGISPKHKERIFEPFFTTKEVGMGSGQGLAIARNIVVDKHQGSLTFVSDEQTGSTFTILLPVDGAARKGP